MSCTRITSSASRCSISTPRSRRQMLDEVARVGHPFMRLAVVTTFAVSGIGKGVLAGIEQRRVVEGHVDPDEGYPFVMIYGQDGIGKGVLAGIEQRRVVKRHVGAA